MRLECIDDDVYPSWRRLVEIHPVKGRIYTLRESFDEEGYTYIRLVEIVNKLMDYGEPYGMQEVAFNREKFRPVTDISALTKLTKVKELEDA